MRSSEYFRAQARLYVDIARLITDPKDAEKALAIAADYLVRAKELEQAERVSAAMTRRT